MTVHCFGLTSSPSLAGFALRRIAEAILITAGECVGGCGKGGT